MPEMEYVDNRDKLEKCLEECALSPRLALDIETYTKDKEAPESHRLSAHYGDISIMSIAREEPYENTVKVYVIDWQIMGECITESALNEVLSSREYLIAHNAVFDGTFLRANLGQPFLNWHCTYYLSLLLANATGSKFGRMRGHSLADLCRDFLGIYLEGKGSLQRSEWGVSNRNINDPVWAEKITYAAKDVTYLFKLHDILYTSLTSAKPFGLDMQFVTDLEMQNISSVIEMQYNGLPLNLQLSQALDKEIQLKQQHLAVKLCEKLELPTIVIDFFSPEIASPEALTALNNPKKLVSILSKKLGNDLPNTQSALLERLLEVLDQLSTTGSFDFVDEEEQMLYAELQSLEQSVLVQSSQLIRDIIEYRRLTKQTAFSLEQYLNSKTKRVHPSYNALGTATGRFSSSKPNAQQISAKLSLFIPFDLNFY